jgi:hypothetical protein
MRDFWYYAYGSNARLAGLAAYLTPTEDRAKTLTAPGLTNELNVPYKTLLVPYPVYFAGKSKTWGGSVAFLSLESTPDLQAVGRAYLLNGAQLLSVLQKENGAPGLRLPDLNKVTKPLDLGLPNDPDGYRNKYNVIMPLGNLDGRSVFTATTNRPLKKSVPGAAYTAQVLAGISEILGEAAAQEYVQAALSRAEAAK